MIKNTLASVLGIATTFVLVLFMIAMIKNKPVSVPKTTIVELDLESFRLPEPEPPKVITDKRPLPEKPEKISQPTIPTVQVFDLPSPTEPNPITIDLPKLTPVNGKNVTTVVGAPSNVGDETDATPIVQIEPRYPADMAASGKEGFVLLQYSVKADGSVADVKILDAHPKKVFNREAKRALSRWRYRPKLEGGKATVQEGLTIKLEFKLDS